MFSGMLGTEKIPVLLVEDSRSQAHVTQRQLYAVDDEFDISRVSNLEDAMERIAHGHFGAVILDLGLPDSDGPESIHMLHQQFPDLPIIVLSGRSDAATVRRALEYGALEFLSKNDCSGKMIRQALLRAIVRQSLKTAS